MQRRWMSATLFLLFLLESTVFQLLLFGRYGSDYSIFPRFMLIFIIYISIYKDKKFALIAGLIFGLLHDIVLGRVIGVYMIGMAGIAYFSGWLTQHFHPTFLLYFLAELIGNLAFELYLYGMLRLYQLINIPFNWMASNILIPTVIFNLFFALVFYLPLRKLIEGSE
ncbi:rod shape-determining protein MreD [Vulcanibacillus modesticaldus]|uniref:Rod shape-determining protein MreD n=1 Tax=Vulcanibacillus modesticaldus TaxID=337097 RepID=A0A1D2YSQ3_9BACI|nr:rod shape-determining protein MreD [Vulcanibacillus modesticaldus]OEF98044.1 rod shape-determining protein MreD [Vulcanibacillus modesticaldus]